MKKYVYLIGSIVMSVLLLVGLCIGELESVPAIGSIIGIVLGLYLPIVGKLYVDCFDVNSWQIQLRKLRRGKILKGNDKVRISFAYLYRIKVNDKYLLVENERGTKKYQPVGGTYKYNNEEKLYFSNKFSIVEDSKIKLDDSSKNDYRLHVSVKDLKKFVKRFNQTQNRENLKNLSREFKEELVDKEILNFEHIQYRYCGRHITSIEKSRHFNCYELLLADIVELIPDENQNNILRNLYDIESEKYYFATAGEIYSCGIKEGTDELMEKIGDHTVKILQETECELIKDKKVENCIYTVSLVEDNSSEDNVIVEDDKEDIQNEMLIECSGRRENRFVGILSLLVITGTLFSLVFKMMLKVINVWPTNGVVYQYMQIMMSVLVTSLIIVIIRAVLFCLVDLQRYDLSRNDLKKLDEISDLSYGKLIWHFKFCLTICILDLIASAPIQLLDEGTKRNILIGSVVFGVVVVGLLALAISQAVKFIRGKYELVKTIVINFFIFVFITALIYLAGLSLVIPNKDIIDTSFDKNGTVSINVESSQSYADLFIGIYDANSGMQLWQRKVDKTELLIAKEDKYVNGNSDGTTESKSQGLLINSEILYSYYSFELNKISEIKEGKYYIEITSEQEGKKVQLINTFIYNGQFEFAKTEIEKQY